MVAQLLLCHTAMHIGKHLPQVWRQAWWAARPIAELRLKSGRIYAKGTPV